MAVSALFLVLVAPAFKFTPGSKSASAMPRLAFAFCKFKYAMRKFVFFSSALSTREFKFSS